MKRWMAGVLVAVSALLVVDGIAEAKRLGGGGSTGLRRSVPTQPAPATPGAAPQSPQTPPASPAVPGAAATGAAAAAAAAPARRSWMGPIAGLAAGLGLAALASHFGFGEALANAMTMALLVLLGIVVVRWLMRRFAGGAAARPPYATAGAAAGTSGAPAAASAMPFERGAAAPSSGVAPAARQPLPADFDREAFQRLAKMIFIRLQAANDAGDLDDLRRFTTPELFAAAKLDLQERGARTQRTDVVQIDADVLDVAVEDGRQVVSVRYTGLIREEQDAGAVPFDEIWHVVRPADGRGDWAIAGIQQMADAHG